MSVTYTIRESPKAKHVSLKISAGGRLEVVVPFGFDQTRVPEIVQKKQRWIDRVQQRLQIHQEPSKVAEPLPRQLVLHALNQTWQVEYCPTRWSGVRLTEHSGFKLVLTGAIADEAACRAVLRQWLLKQAKTYLVPWLRSVSQQVGLPFEQATVRQQKTRWGSCSGRKTISLNAKLLFLPGSIVRYVLIHELCHTIHLNHSAQFWALVHRHEPNYRRLDAQLREVSQWVPVWVEWE